jgi:hypothetical protein
LLLNSPNLVVLVVWFVSDFLSFFFPPPVAMIFFFWIRV